MQRSSRCSVLMHVLVNPKERINVQARWLRALFTEEDRRESSSVWKKQISNCVLAIIFSIKHYWRIWLLGYHFVIIFSLLSWFRSSFLIPACTSCVLYMYCLVHTLWLCEYYDAVQSLAFHTDKSTAWHGYAFIFYPNL